MKHRKLRIAWSVAWGLAAALLVVLWVRSNAVGDDFPDPLVERGNLAIYSTAGVMRIVEAMWIKYSPPSDYFVSYYIPPRFQSVDGGFAITKQEGLWRFKIAIRSRKAWLLQFPYWFVVTLSAAFTVAPWSRHLRWRFSLGTLLIATTLVAVGLRLIVWAAH